MSELYPPTAVCPVCGRAGLGVHVARGTGESVLVDPRTGLPHFEVCRRRRQDGERRAAPRDGWLPYRAYPEDDG
jgi:hypothetical protein